MIRDIIYNKIEFDTQVIDKDNVHLLDDYTCGKDAIDTYIKENASCDTYSGEGVTNLVVNEKQNRLIAYYTLRATSILFCNEIEASEIINIQDVKISGIPCIEIKMFAVNKYYQDLLYKDRENNTEIVVSDMILQSVISEIFNISISIMGAKVIFLHATTEAVNFYLRNGFQILNDYTALYDDYAEDCTPMFMRLHA